MSAGMVYVISGRKDVVLVVDGVDDELYVVGAVPGPFWHEELPAIAVMVRDGAVEDDKALRSRVVSAKLSKIQVRVQGVRLWGGGASVDKDWLRQQRWGWGQRWWRLRGLGRGRAQAVTEGEWSRRAFDMVDEGWGSSHGANDNG